MNRSEIPSSLPIPDRLRNDGWWLKSEPVCERVLSRRCGAPMLAMADNGPKENIADDTIR